MTAESDTVGNQEPGQPPSAPRASLKPWLLSLPPALVMLMVGWRWGGLPCGLFYAALAFLAVLAATHQPAGLLVLLSLAPFDQLINEQLRPRCTWYPLPLHVIDPIAVGLLLGWALGFLRGRGWREFARCDWVAFAFFTILTIEAIRGVLTGEEYALRTARFIPLLAAYFPARAVLSDPHNRKLMAAWLPEFGVSFAVITVALAFLLRAQYSRPAEDVLLPRLCYLVDIRISLLLLFVAWAALWEHPTSSRREGLLLAAIVGLGGLMAINNTRTFYLGILVAWAVLCLLLWKAKCKRGTFIHVAVGGLALIVIGVLFVHAMEAARPSARFWIARLRQERLSPAQVAEARRQTEARLFEVEQRVRKAETALQDAESEAAGTTDPLQAARARERIAPAKREIEAARAGYRVAMGAVARAKAQSRLAEQLSSGAAPQVKVDASSVASSMRLAPRGGFHASQYSISNRVREARAVISDLSPLTLLVGHGVGKPVRYRYIQWNGQEELMSLDFIHNSYIFLLHTTGLLGLGLCLAWLVSILRRGARRLSEVANPHVPVLWLGSLLFVCASLVMALTVGTLNAPHAGPLLASALAVASRDAWA